MLTPSPASVPTLVSPPALAVPLSLVSPALTSPPALASPPALTASLVPALAPARVLPLDAISEVVPPAEDPSQTLAAAQNKNLSLLLETTLSTDAFVRTKEPGSSGDPSTSILGHTENSDSPAVKKTSKKTPAKKKKGLAQKYTAR